MWIHRELQEQLWSIYRGRMGTHAWTYLEDVHMATKIIKGKKYAVATKISPFVDQILNDLKH